MILTVNLGNTHITIGGYEHDDLKFCGRLHTDPAATVDEYGLRLLNLLSLHGASPEQIEGGILGSVVPALTGRVLAALQMLCPVRILTVGPGLKSGIRLRLDNPAQLGAELLCGAVAALAEGSGPLVVISADTAISLMAVNGKQELVTDTAQVDRSYEVEFPLASITRPVLIENIFYEFDRADLTPASTTALDELIALLNDNPNVTIELAAHCDYKGNDAYNERLSQRRAESVVRYLIKGGISEDRLTAKGYGESKPKVVNKSVLKTAPFLKEGNVLTEGFIKTLTPEQQEICNAINRRTEFQVLRTTYGLYK